MFTQNMFLLLKNSDNNIRGVTVHTNDISVHTSVLKTWFGLFFGTEGEKNKPFFKQWFTEQTMPVFK